MWNKLGTWKKILAVLIVALLFIILISRSFTEEKSEEEGNFWNVKNGVLSFTESESLEYTPQVTEVESWYSIYNITYLSRGKEIYARAFIPNNGLGKGIVTLHAARASKEHHDTLDKKLMLNGYAVISIDQRGHGMTGGESPTLNDDYQRYLNKEEPITYLYIYDAILAANILREFGIKDIAYLGESMGGRFAIISAALDNKSSGVIVYSTGGIEVLEENLFIDSIDPNNYVDKISPKKTVIYHAAADEVIPIWLAEKLYALAKEPKKFVPMRGTCMHGYCDLMDEFMFKDLAWIFEKETL